MPTRGPEAPGGAPAVLEQSGIMMDQHTRRLTDLTYGVIIRKATRPIS